ncbi:hypothetical protein [Methylovirgula sp. HY1]|uniref:hypothetical protein n=1 Tax=Methylovirgula sp. HY1 TaxID=2822761 RepID=UPI001C5A9EA2|nr:hypothetical protein [Methylovirgula sp. HY1]
MNAPSKPTRPPFNVASVKSIQAPKNMDGADISKGHAALRRAFKLRYAYDEGGGPQ